MGHRLSYDVSNYNSNNTANGGGYDPASVQSGALTTQKTWNGGGGFSRNGTGMQLDSSPQNSFQGSGLLNQNRHQGNLSTHLMPNGAGLNMGEAGLDGLYGGMMDHPM